MILGPRHGAGMGDAHDVMRLWISRCAVLDLPAQSRVGFTGPGPLHTTGSPRPCSPRYRRTADTKFRSAVLPPRILVFTPLIPAAGGNPPRPSPCVSFTCREPSAGRPAHLADGAAGDPEPARTGHPSGALGREGWTLSPLTRRAMRADDVADGTGPHRQLRGCGGAHTVRLLARPRRGLRGLGGVSLGRACRLLAGGTASGHGHGGGGSGPAPIPGSAGWSRAERPGPGGPVPGPRE